MQARSKTFATDHIVLSALALSLLVSVLTLIATLMLTGEMPSLRSSGNSTVVQPAAAQPSTFDRSSRGLDPGITTSQATRGNVAAQPVGRGVDRDHGLVSGNAVQRSWGLGVGFDAGPVIAPSSGDRGVRQLPGFGIGLDPGFTSNNAVRQLTGNGVGLTEH